MIGRVMASRKRLEREHKELVDLEVQVRHETNQAVLLFDGGTEAWVPKSLCQDNRDGTFTMPVWIAKQVGFV
jgi:hypothetical protein